jgi:hypothetical protein
MRSVSSAAGSLAALRDEFPSCARSPVEQMGDILGREAVFDDPGHDARVQRVLLLNSLPSAAELRGVLLLPRQRLGRLIALHRDFINTAARILGQSLMIFHGDLARRLAQTLDRAMAQNDRYPSQQIRIAAEGRTALPDLDEGILHQVASRVGVPQRAHAVPIQGGKIRSIQFAQRPLDGGPALAAGKHEHGLIQRVEALVLIVAGSTALE